MKISRTNEHWKECNCERGFWRPLFCGIVQFYVLNWRGRGGDLSNFLSPFSGGTRVIVRAGWTTTSASNTGRAVDSLGEHLAKKNIVFFWRFQSNLKFMSNAVVPHLREYTCTVRVHLENITCLQSGCGSTTIDCGDKRYGTQNRSNTIRWMLFLFTALYFLKKTIII